MLKKQVEPTRFFYVTWRVATTLAYALFQGRNQLISGVAIFMKFNSITASCLFNRGTTFSQTVTDKVLFAAFPKMRTLQF